MRPHPTWLVRRRHSNGRSRRLVSSRSPSYYISEARTRAGRPPSMAERWWWFRASYRGSIGYIYTASVPPRQNSSYGIGLSPTCWWDVHGWQLRTSTVGPCCGWSTLNHWPWRRTALISLHALGGSTVPWGSGHRLRWLQRCAMSRFLPCSNAPTGRCGSFIACKSKRWTECF